VNLKEKDDRAKVTGDELKSQGWGQPCFMPCLWDSGMVNFIYMSMQRVFEMARKMGLPVVVTDVTGREPFVLLPLDQFEAMMGEGAVAPARPPAEVRGDASASEAPTAIVEPVGAIHELPLPVPTELLEKVIKDEILLGRAEKQQNSSYIESLKVEVPEKDELSMEERFYVDSTEAERGD